LEKYISFIIFLSNFGNVRVAGNPHRVSILPFVF
jgi:hypothetical protein